MAGLHSHTNPPDVSEDASSIARNSRIGLWLFAVYFVLYGSFVLLNTFSSSTMEMTPIAGINLAVIYGIALILAAVVMALIYGWLCTSAQTTNGSSKKSESQA